MEKSLNMAHKHQNHHQWSLFLKLFLPLCAISPQEINYLPPLVIHLPIWKPHANNCPSIFNIMFCLYLGHPLQNTSSLRHHIGVSFPPNDLAFSIIGCRNQSVTDSWRPSWTHYAAFFGSNTFFIQINSPKSQGFYHLS